jgi:hypothetical protein
MVVPFFAQNLHTTGSASMNWHAARSFGPIGC